MIDAAMIEAFRRWLMYACLAGLAAFVLIVFCSAVLPPLCEAWRRMRAKSRAASAAFAAAAVAAILYAGVRMVLPRVDAGDGTRDPPRLRLRGRRARRGVGHERADVGGRDDRRHAT